MNTPDLENIQTATPLPPQHANASAPVTSDAGETVDTSTQVSASTLIEFPGKNRAPRPAWRKELSERVREIQQRRAREAALDTEPTAPEQTDVARPVTVADDRAIKAKKAEERAKQLGLVPPPPDLPEMNPLVVAALKRIERARISDAPRGRATRAAHAATAVARMAEDEYEPEVENPPVVAKSAKRESLKPAPPPAEATPHAELNEPRPEAARLPNLVAVPPKPPALEAPGEAVSQMPPVAPPGIGLDSPSKPVVSAPPAMPEDIEQKVSVAPAHSHSIAASAPVVDNPHSKPQPRRIVGVIDDHWLERNAADSLPKVVSAKELYDDRAPLDRRVAAALIDLIVVAFLSAPFAAIIELTIGNWGDPRVQISMGSIVFLLMFLYLTCSTALAGRTWGMSLFSLHTVDANSALAPTTGQCMRRALVYMLTLATLGLGLLYALFDAEGRAAHDLLSRTIVVKE